MKAELQKAGNPLHQGAALTSAVRVVSWRSVAIAIVVLSLLAVLGFSVRVRTSTCVSLIFRVYDQTGAVSSVRLELTNGTSRTVLFTTRAPFNFWGSPPYHVIQEKVGGRWFDKKASWEGDRGVPISLPSGQTLQFTVPLGT